MSAFRTHRYRDISEQVQDLLSSVRAGEPVAISALEGLGEPKALYIMAPLLRHSLPQVRKAIGEAATRLIRKFPLKHFLSLDAEVRKRFFVQGNGVPDQSDLSLTTPHPGSLGLASMSPSGRLREAAVRELGRLKVAWAIPFLLVRLADWVPSIRLAARQALEPLLIQEFAQTWVVQLPLIQRLEAKQRADSEWLRHRILAVLQDPSSRPILESALGAKDPETRRAAFKFTWAGSEHGSLLWIALSTRDSTLNVWAARLVKGSTSVVDIAGAAKRLLGHPHPLVRREGVYLAAQQPDSDIRAALRTMLLDPDNRARNAARVYLADMEPLDARAFYLEHVARRDPNTLRAAILGLRDCGQAADAQRLAEFLASPRTSVRLAATQTIGKLAPREFANELVRMLRDPSARPALAASVSLESHLDVVPIETLEHLLSADELPHTRHAAFRLLSHRSARASSWERGIFLLNEVARNDRVTNLLAIEQLRTWIWHLTSAPIPEQGARFQAQFLHAEPLVPADVARAIRDRCRPYC